LTAVGARGPVGDKLPGHVEEWCAGESRKRIPKPSFERRMAGSQRRATAKKEMKRIYGALDPCVPMQVRFQKIAVASHDDVFEDPTLIWADERLLALLVPAKEGWFLHVRFGQSQREGLLFPTLDAADTWVRDQTQMERRGCSPG
jgi:hypothetical protein